MLYIDDVSSRIGLALIVITVSAVGMGCASSGGANGEGSAAEQVERQGQDDVGEVLNTREISPKQVPIVNNVPDEDVEPVADVSCLLKTGILKSFRAVPACRDYLRAQALDHGAEVIVSTTNQIDSEQGYADIYMLGTAYQRVE